MESGPDGVHLRSDCGCEDATPYCQARCCYVPGTYVTEEEKPKVEEAAIKAGIRLPVVQKVAPD